MLQAPTAAKTGKNTTSTTPMVNEKLISSFRFYHEW
jgi:hypothetical protein